MALRFVSFEPKLRTRIEEAQEKGSPVELRNCAVKRNRQQELEVLASTHTKIENSPKKFKISENAVQQCEVGKCTEICTLEELNDIDELQGVMVTGKVISLMPIEEISIKSSGKVVRKRDVLLADKTAIYRCVAWENLIEMFEEEYSYRLSNAIVKSFNGEKYLSLGMNCDVGKIEDIGDVVDDQLLPEGNPARAKVIAAEIVTVVSVEVYRRCRNCSTKISESDTQFVVCSKCGSKVKFSKCANGSVANVILEDKDKREYRVAIFEEVLSIVSGYGRDVVGECDIEDQLLSSPPLKYTINQKDIVCSISKID